MGRCEVKEAQMLDLIKAAWEECYPGQTWLDTNSVVTPAHVPQLWQRPLSIISFFSMANPLLSITTLREGKN